MNTYQPNQPITASQAQPAVPAMPKNQAPLPEIVRQKEADPVRVSDLVDELRHLAEDAMEFIDDRNGSSARLLASIQSAWKTIREAAENDDPIFTMEELEACPGGKRLIEGVDLSDGAMLSADRDDIEHGPWWIQTPASGGKGEAIGPVFHGDLRRSFADICTRLGCAAPADRPDT